MGLKTLYGLLSMLILTSMVFAEEDVVSIKLIRSADNAVVETAYSGYAHEFQISIETIGWIYENMHLGFKISSIDGITWTWDAQPSGLGNHMAVTETPGSRMNDCWSMTGLLVSETNMDGVLNDSIGIGGVAFLGAGLPPGPMEPICEFHFTPQISVEDGTGTICIDSAFLPPAGAWLLAVSSDPYSIPRIDGPFCWPVVEFEPLLGDFDLDGQITVGDAVEMIQHIFLDKPHFAPVETGDVNCDGQMNVGDAIYMIAYIFRFGPPPGCP